MNRRRESSKARRRESPDQTLDRLIEMERRARSSPPAERTQGLRRLKEIEEAGGHGEGSTVEIEMKFNVKEKFIGNTRGKVRL